MKSVLFALLAMLLLQSCSKEVYNVYVNDVTVHMYSSPGSEQPLKTIYPGQSIVVKKEKKKYSLVHYNGFYGWMSIDSLRYVSKTNKSAYGDPASKSVTNYATGYSPQKKEQTGSSSYSGGNTSSGSSAGGAVHVNGYYRKDGTYVHPYTRSAPRRKG